MDGRAAARRDAWLPSTRTRAHLQALHVEFLPVVLLAADRLLVRRRTRDAILLGLAAALQSLTSNYLMAATVVAGAAILAARVGEVARPAPRRVLLLFALAAAVGAALVAPFLLPYAAARREQGLVRTLDEVARYSSTWRDYVSTAGRFHYAWWSHRFFEGSTALFPGVTAVLLASVSLVAAPGWRDGRVRMAAASARQRGLVVRAALPGHAALHRWLPLLGGGAARFGFLALVAVAAPGVWRGGHRRAGPAAGGGRRSRRPSCWSTPKPAGPSPPGRSPGSRICSRCAIVGPRGRRVPVRHARDDRAERALRAQFHRLLEAARERLQRLRAPELRGYGRGPARLSR